MPVKHCTIDGCEASHIARGWCHRHYKRWQTFGHPTEGGPERGPSGKGVEARFWAKVNKTPTCWLWTGADKGDGYGSFYVDPTRGRQSAHRVSWTLAGRELIDGMDLDHLCRVHSCVNPDHLEQVPHRVNVLRGTSFMASRAAQTHCKNGHPLTGDNLKMTDSGRRCRECKRTANREDKRRKRAAT